MCTNLACPTHFSIQSFSWGRNVSVPWTFGASLSAIYLAHTKMVVSSGWQQFFNLLSTETERCILFVGYYSSNMSAALFGTQILFLSIYCLSHGYYPWYVQKKDACVIAISVCIFSCFHCLLCKMTYTTGVVRYSPKPPSPVWNFLVCEESFSSISLLVTVSFHLHASVIAKRI